MALGATVYRFLVTLSDVDRGVYESLDVRVARHPSESARYMLTRTLGYCLSYEEGIVFSKGGISSTDEPPIAIRDATGVLRAWIEIGSPSAERLHKAAKAAPRVELYTCAELSSLRREAATRAVHRLEEIVVLRFEPAFLDALDAKVEKNTSFELVRNSGELYVSVAGATLDSALTTASLCEVAAEAR
jgi:uncharacterized protein YaeQ